MWANKKQVQIFVGPNLEAAEKKFNKLLKRGPIELHEIKLTRPHNNEVGILATYKERDHHYWRAQAQRELGE